MFSLYTHFNFFFLSLFVLSLKDAIFVTLFLSTISLSFLHQITPFHHQNFSFFLLYKPQKLLLSKILLTMAASTRAANKKQKLPQLQRMLPVPLPPYLPLPYLDSSLRSLRWMSTLRTSRKGTLSC